MRCAKASSPAWTRLPPTRPSRPSLSSVPIACFRAERISGKRGIPFTPGRQWVCQRWRCMWPARWRRLGERACERATPSLLVTSQVSRGGSGGVEFVDQVFGVSHEALDDTPAALFGSADERSDRSEIVCTLERAEAARDFLLELHHPAVAFSLVVGERHIRVGQEAQNSLFVVSQAQDEVMPDATLWAAGARGAVLPQFLWQSREPLVKGCSVRNDCIVAPTNEVDQALIGGLLFVPRQVLDMAGTAQQDLHLAPPV